MFYINQIGNTLKEAREKNGLSLEEAGKDLDIKPLILANIEAGNIGCFKDIFELKEYIASYAKYLGLDAIKMVDKFNEYLFEYTSKIPIKEIEEKIKEQKKQEDDENKIFSPYTKQINIKNKHIIWIYVIIAIVVALVIFWAVKQITVDNTKTRAVSIVR